MLNRIITLLLLAGFVSCSTDSPDTQGGAKIGFGIDLTQSKGILVTEGQGVKTMGMFSIYTKNTFPNSDAHIQMENIQVYRANGNGSFIYSPISYWPNDGYLSFQAYSPFATVDNGISAVLRNKQYVEITYSNSTRLSAQSDLMVASTLNVPGLSPGATTAPEVKLPFRHILSSVIFKGKYRTNYVNPVVKIKQITLQGFYGSGTYSMDYPAGWTLSGSASDTYQLNALNGLQDLTLTTTDQIINNEGSALLLLPQSIPAEGLPMEILLEVTENGITETKAEQTRFKVDSRLVDGIKYIISIVYDVADSEASVSLSYEVVDWDCKIINLPGFN
ncbi:MAG: fimbrillin family protein [Bacteroidales bacterium]